ncbi:MAG: hypothetical protein CMD02_04785 [Flavobacteriales bacterium]|nr:hypothetical protein [Flavobacteriales bacterium]|tara:strand:+ start:2762 stop:4861 length:2100 start_codon:yes stop_codon:yes gene_type:complete
MKKHISLALFTVVFNTVLTSQNISELENVRNIIVENFNESESSFPILTNIDNYFIIDNGDYLLSRNNTESEYAILASSTEMITDFTLKTAIKVGPSSFKRSSAGILIKAQVAGSGALVFEINRKGEFRIKELQNNTYKYLSGKSSNEGWVKNKEIKGQDEFNAIEIRCKDNVYDIYVNNNFITNLFSSTYSSGRMGILIGRDAKARVAYYHLDVPSNTQNNLIKEHMSDFNVENLTNRVKQLESEKVTLNNTNSRLEEEVKLLKNNNFNKIEKELENSKNRIDSLSKIISELNDDLEVSNNLLSEERKKFNNSNAEVEKGNKLISEFNLKQKEFMSKISNLESNIIKLNNKSTELKTELDSKQYRLDSQVELNEELQKNNSTLLNKSNSEIDKNKNLQSEIANLKNKVSDLNINLNQAEDKIQNLNKKLQRKKEELNNSEKKSANLQEKVTTLNSNISSLNSDINTINSKLNKQKSNYSIVEKDLKNKLNNKTSEITKLNKEISRLQKKYSSYEMLDEKNKDLNTSINEKDITINNLSSKISELNKFIYDLENKNSILTKSEFDKSEQITLLTNTLEDLNTKVENMKNVLIYKGFEEKGLQSDKVTTTKVENKKQNTKKKRKENNDKNVTYSVQIATYGEKVTMNQFNGLKDVFYIDSENGTFLYMSGKFNNSNGAIEHRNTLVKLGFKEAFVVKLNNR